MSRLACTAFFTLAVLHLAAAAPVAGGPALPDPHPPLDARRAYSADDAVLDRRADGGSANTSTSLLDVVSAAVIKLSQASVAKTAGLSTTRKSYSALIAFGASYTDNAHARPSTDKGSLRNYAPFTKFDGRYSNGPVAVEYMVQKDLTPALPQGPGGVQLVDYAFGGSVIRNGLTGTGTAYPDAAKQVAKYLADLDSGSVNVGSGRVLHYFNTGINPVLAIYNNMLRAGSDSRAVAYAQSAVTENANALIKTIRSINADSTVSSKINGRDFLIVGIPQMDLTPVARYAIPSSYNQRQRDAALSRLQALTNQYNSALSSFAQSFKSEVSGGQVYYFDLANLWQSLTHSGATYGITQGTKTCLTGSTLCSHPNQYLYLDTLHPVTSVHKIWAQKMNALVAGSSS